jgi:RHS repeat-associated protein
VQFNGSKTISEIDVVTVQDNYNFPVEPTDTMTFSGAGLSGYDVQYWNGSAWVTISGGSVNGNNKVWRKFTFSPITTTKIRVLSNASPDGYSRLTEVEAWTGPSPAPRYDLALASNGAVATASNSYNAGYGPAGTINGDRKSLNWTNGGGWNDSGPPFPDYLEVDFGSVKAVNEIHVFTLQDNYANSAEPTESMTFTLWGLTAFALEYWNGSSWVAIPGASVSGNNKIWRKFTFTPINTSKIRVQTTASVDGYSRITEVEAYGPAESSGAGSVRWLITDHLGTPRMVLDQSGSLANMTRHDYLPFGEELAAPTSGRSAAQGYAGGDSVRQQFTQKERDNETQLDYFGARYYSSAQGRFASVDPDNAGAYRGNPQTWNGYSYALNQPMLYSDPDGKKVRVCGTDGQCTNNETDLTDDQWDNWIRHNRRYKITGNGIYENGQLIGTFDHYSCDSCLYDTVGLARQIDRSDPGRRAVQVWGASVIAGLSIPSSGGLYVFVGVFTVIVPPPGESTGGEIALTTTTDRQAAVREAWKLEAERARSGKPTNTPFTADELRELRDTGKVSGYEGHHVESVSNNPNAARDPKNIKFVKGRAAHLREHGGNWRNRTPLKRR